jgi:hypothetical protein
MPRELRAAWEIRAEVHRLIHATREVREDGESVGVPMPTPLREPDADGCNWDMEWFGNARVYVAAVRIAVANVKERWNLTPGC